MVHPRFRCFPRVFFFNEKQLDLNSLKGQTKAEEVGDRVSELLGLRVPLRLFRSRRFSAVSHGKPDVKDAIQILKNRLAVLRNRNGP